MKCSINLTGLRGSNNSEPTFFLKMMRLISLGRGWSSLQEAVNNWIVKKSEPKIYQRCDRQGNRYYQVYDPVSGISAKFSSETEIRTWIEQRYSR